MENKKLIKSASIYTIGGFLIQILGVLSVPIFTRMLNESDYGYVSIYLTWVSFIGIFVGLGVNGTIGSAKANIEEEEYDKYLSSILILSTISFFIILILGYIFRFQLAALLKIQYELIIFIIIQGFMSFIITFNYADLTFRNEAKKYMEISLIIAILNIILSILLIALLKEEKYLGRIYALFIVNAFFGSIVYVKIIKRGKCFINKKYWMFCMPIAIPIIFHSLSHLVLNQADRIMLQEYTNETIVGVYSFTYTIGILLNMVNMSINNAWVTWYFEKLKNKSKQEIKEKSKIYLSGFTIFTGLFILGSPEVVKILAPRNYWVGINVLPLIIVGYYFVFLYTFPVNYEFYKKKTTYIAIGTIISGCVNIIINILLIPKIGIYGAAISTCIAYLFLFVMHETIVRLILKHSDFKIKYSMIGILEITIITIMTYIAIDKIIVRWAILILIASIYMVKLNKTYKILNLIKEKIKK